MLELSFGLNFWIDSRLPFDRPSYAESGERRVPESLLKFYSTISFFARAHMRPVGEQLKVVTFKLISIPLFYAGDEFRVAAAS